MAQRWQRMVMIALGAALGTVGTVVLVRWLRDRQQAVGGESRLTALPVQAITLRPVGQHAIQTVSLPLTISADPVKFTRRQRGTIRVETLPGASCTIHALYSTGASPASLNTEPVTADGQGHCEWSWLIGTSGKYVEIEVRAWLEGYDRNTVRLQVPIKD